MNKVIIIGGDHHNTLGLIRSFGEVGISPVVYIHGHAAHIVGLSKYIQELQFIEIDNLVDCLISRHSGEPQRPVILCGSDEAIAALDARYDEVSQYFHCFNAKHEQGRINRFMDKNEMQQLAIECGLSCPRTFTATRETIKEGLYPFPCMIKPVNSLNGTKNELLRINSFEELRQSMKVGIEYQLQEFIEKDYELNMVACSLEGGQTIVTPGIIRKIREWPAKKGSSSFSVLEAKEIYKCIDQEKIKRFVSSIGYEGLFSIEFLCKDNVAYFLEINMRNDGNGYVPTSAGVNLPYIWYAYVTGLTRIEFTPPILPHYFMRETTDWEYVRHRNISLIQWLTDIHRTDCFLLYNKHDRTPFWQFWERLIKSKIRIKK